MSLTAVETAAKSSRRPDTMSEAMSEAMSRPYATTATSWSDPHYAPRGSVHQPQMQPHYDHQLSSPASMSTGVPGSRRPSQLQPPQHPRPSHGYQLTDMSTAPQVSHPPPPLSVPSHHTSSGTFDQQRHYEPNVAHPPPPFSSPAIERPDMLQGRHISQPVRVPSISENQQPFAYAQRPPSVDMRAIPRFTGQQFLSATAPMVSGTNPNSPAPSPTESRPDPMRISDLLSPGAGSGSRSSSISSSKRPGDVDANYKLRIRQQPVAARSCGFGERDRRVVDPPPIVQLIIEGPNLTPEEISKQLRYCHYVMSCSIYDESGARDASFMPEEYRQQRRLMGSLVGAPFVGKDEHNEEGCFFCFPDLSCRTPGSFRLKFSLVKIDPARARELRHFPVLVEAKSDVFTVYTAKDFPGMQASTRLTKRLKEQGCIISIKKGNDRSKNARGHDDSSDGEPDDGETSSQGKRRRRSAR
ncbi:Sexual development regulator velC [Fusarium keratoplasticum]|uniref:Sexual development regulator velC n=1 Tax=Fusarium keratoplasticum TaxID=1328300 RepID=A0ACC0R457_9HYPO|nr:Sexual development regulator velC [Fusarium keratoplasticum]KAI8671390.1 Sexual development regulator velC [Fusarium keratoplasticum]KAI8678619.1 Sexual development regulator velC [Fusarium keratoplasticum]